VATAMIILLPGALSLAIFAKLYPSTAERKF
jgi:hypothetical protein